MRSALRRATSAPPPALTAPVGLVLALLAGCGGAASSPPDAGGGDASVLVLGDAAATWVDGGPSFGGDGGAPDVPPSPASCQGKAAMSGDPYLTLPSHGLLRGTLVHIPSGYDPTRPHPLVLNFHGYSSNGGQQALVSNMDPLADDKGVIVAYPDGVANSWNAGQCCGTAWLDAVDDVGFVRDLLAFLEDRLCVDTKRVYSTGLSNGGFLTYRLACEMADTFAAASPVAGVVGVPFDGCQPSRPIPVLHFHGTADPLVPYDGGVPLVMSSWPGTLDFASVADTIQLFQMREGCDATGGVVIYQRGDATCTEWARCAPHGEVDLCVIAGGGHTWPGGVPIPFGKTSTDINASATMLDFFLAHPLR